MMFLANALWENTVTTNIQHRRQRLRDNTIKFTRGQHHATERGASNAVPDATHFSLN